MKVTKILALLLALATALSFASFGASAEDVSFEYLYDEAPYTAIGTYEVTPLDTVDVTGYCFTPDAAGSYEISLLTDGAVLHNLTGSPFFASYDSVNEEGKITFIVAEDGVGSSCLFGVQYAGTVTVSIALSDAEAPEPEYTDWEIYENDSTPTDFTLGLEEGESLSYVNVFEEHTAVLGEDGFYHLDSADGPILYVDFKKAPYSFYDILSAGPVRDYFFDADGNFINRVDYTDAMLEYLNCADNNIYPLTADLAHVIKTHGENQGWYDADGENCWFGTPENLVEETAWMYACAYVEANEEESSEESSEDVSSEESSVEEIPFILGDVNMDGSINSIDAAQILKHDALLVEFDIDRLLRGDVNGDAGVNSLDAAQVLKYDALLIDSFSGTVDEDEPEYGTEELPHPVIAAEQYVVAPGATVFFDITYKNGMTLTLTAGDFYEECAITDLHQIVSFTNDGDETVVLSIDFKLPAGHMENPIELVMGENIVEVEAGDADGVFYTWTASEAGTLTITMPEGNWQYTINNLTTGIYGDSQWSDSDPVVATATVEVAAGDVIQLSFNSYDPATPWTAPEAQFTVTASFN